MWYALDLLLCAWLAASAWWLWRRGAIGGLHAASGALLGYAAASAAGIGGDLLLRLAQPNLWLRLAAFAVLGMAAFAVVAWAWGRGAVERRARWQRRLGDGLAANALRVTLLAGWLAGNLLAWLLLVNLLAAVPGIGAGVRDSSLVSHLLLGSPADASWRRDLDDQQRALRGFDGVRDGGALRGGVDRLLAATGTREAIEMMDTLEWIAALPSGQRERLFEEVPELHRLAELPELRAVTGDERLMALVLSAGDGEMQAVYALGGEPAVQALCDSPAMRAALRAIDLPAARRRMAGTPTSPPGGWRTAVLASSLDLDACLADPTRWSDAPEGAIVQWPDGTRYGLMRGRLPATAAGARLRLATAAELSCWVAGTLVKAERGRGKRVREVALPTAAAGSRQGPDAVVLLDFGGTDGLRVCSARVVSGDARD